MPRLSIPQRNVGQPTEPRQVDWSNPLTQNLAVATYCTEDKALMDMVSWRRFTDIYNPGFAFTSYTKWGRGRTTNGASFNVNMSVKTGQNIGARQTTMVLMRPRNLPTATRPIVKAGSAIGWFPGNIQLTLDGKIDAAVTNGPALQSDEALVMGEHYTVTSVCNVPPGTAPGLQYLFINGVKQAAQTTYTGIRGQGLETIQVGNFQTTQMVDIFAVFVWNRVLSDDEIRQVSDNPYQLFQPRLGMFLSKAAQQALIQRRALGFNGPYLCELSQGSGKRPVVLLNGKLQERVDSEGAPVILDQGQLRTLGAAESLIY